jgi:1,2-phenylacetyl-CoA epoxidase catalytic subunit
MGEFGANTDQYVNHHPWTDRLPRDTPAGTTRSAHDMRLSVLNYPLEGWADAVVMNMLLGLAVGVQLSEFVGCSYQPFAEAIREIAPRERRHTELAIEGVEKLMAQGDVGQINDSIAYWWPRVSESFGSRATSRNEHLAKLGLRTTSAADLHAKWAKQARKTLTDLGLKPLA